MEGKGKEEREGEARVQVRTDTHFVPGLPQEESIFHNMQYNHQPDSDRRRRLCLENLPGMYNMSCTQLLALADTVGTSSSLSSHFSMDSWINSWKMESNPWILNAGSSLGINTGIAAERTMKNPQYDVSTPHKFICDLNLTPEEMVSTSSQPTEPDFSQITLDTPGKRLPVTDPEPHDPMKKKSLLETGSPAGKKKGKRARDGDTIQLKTPKQTLKRKKVRPKVVREGKTNRPSSKSGVKKPSVAVAATKTSEASSYVRPKRSSRRSLRFGYDLQEDDAYCGLSFTSEGHIGTSSGGQELTDSRLRIFNNIPKRRRQSRTNGTMRKERIYPVSEPSNDCLSSMLSLVNTGSTTFMEPKENLPSDSHISQCLGGINDHKKLGRKRSSIVTRPRNFRSLRTVLEGIVQIKCDRKGYERRFQQQLKDIVSQMQSTVSRKKRSQRDPIASQLNARVLHMQWRRQNSTGTSPAELWEKSFSIDAITELFKELDINREGPCLPQNRETALILHKKAYQEQKALVQYMRDVKKHQPKVQLDAETTRVWKLLMVSIDSEGVDGSDDDKQKWWEEERNMFHGRANSFIARMRLVQGDRRFSPWKGSVVDSVVGVFLTQNVADHSSSSAYMDLAAEFPINLNFNKGSCYEEWGSSVTHETVMNLDPGNAVATPRIRNPTCIIIQEIDDDDDDITDTVSQETSKTSDSSISSANQAKMMLLDPPTNSFETHFDSEARETVNYDEEKKERACFMRKAEEKAVSTGVVFNNLYGPSPDLLEQDTKEKGGRNSLFPFDTVLVNEQADPQMVKGKSQMPNTDGLNGFSQGIPVVSSTSTCFELNLNEVPLEVENCDALRNKVDEDSRVQPICSHQQEPKSTLQAQDNEKNTRTGHHLNSDVKNGKNRKKPTTSRPVGRPAKNKPKEPAKNKRKEPAKNKPTEKFDWDSLRRQAESGGQKREKTERTMNTVDWDALRCTNVNKIAAIIRKRGMNNMLSKRIKAFLNRLVQDHGSIDLEWLRDVPPDKAKEYLLSINGLGLKSVECVRLLSLHQIAFPVDVNVGRIAVRLGWVPLQPLPDELQMHLLELYPVLESVQKYLWPRLCKLDQKTFNSTVSYNSWYELHYHMITFGKVFCTKAKPNCNACPMKAECRHYSSARASARLALPEPEERTTVIAHERRYKSKHVVVDFRQPLFLFQEQEQEAQRSQTCEPIIEEPTTPEPEYIEHDIEDYPWDNNVEGDTSKDPWENKDVIPIIMLNKEAGTSKDLVIISTQAASIPKHKLKSMEKLRTAHHVYELPDYHPILEGFERREIEDMVPYLLAIWTPGETINSIQPPEQRCVSHESSTLCHEKKCFLCNNIREEKSQIVRGTILIPCRTAMRGGFPLNGTYFQINEVFTDHGSSINPIDVPRQWLWNLPRRITYFGSSVSAICGGLSLEAIQYSFRRGYVCVRGFDRENRKPHSLVKRLHCPPSKLNKEDEE